MLLAAYLPILMLYCVWLPLTCLGRLEHLQRDVRERGFELIDRSSSGGGQVLALQEDSSDLWMYEFSDDSTGCVDSTEGEKEDSADAADSNRQKQGIASSGDIVEV